jgi:hypothetical protein
LDTSGALPSCKGTNEKDVSDDQGLRKESQELSRNRMSVYHLSDEFERERVTMRANTDSRLSTFVGHV